MRIFSFDLKLIFLCVNARF